MKIISNQEDLSAYLGQDIGNILFNLYDGFIRIVDPNEKTVELIMESFKDSPQKCYALWSRQSACENCICLRAVTNNQPVSKLETDGQEIYLVHAIPLTLSSGKKVAIELLKNLSNTQFVMYSSELSINLDPEFPTLLNFINHLNSCVFRDNLTGAYNREFLLTKISLKMKEKPFTVFMLDINQFKNINDTYEHLAGDAVLKTLAETIHHHLRKDKDYLIRYGGDEFIIFLNDTDEQSAEKIMERLKKEIEKHPAQHENIEISFTTSIGYYTVTEPNPDLEKIIQKADEAMYQAKRASQADLSFSAQPITH